MNGPLEVWIDDVVVDTALARERSSAANMARGRCTPHQALVQQEAPPSTLTSTTLVFEEARPARPLL